MLEKIPFVQVLEARDPFFSKLLVASGLIARAEPTDEYHLKGKIKEVAMFFLTGSSSEFCVNDAADIAHTKTLA